MPELQVFIDEEDGQQTARLIKQYRPDMVWMETPTAEAVGKTTAYVTNIRLLIISHQSNQTQPARGAAGYLLKNASDGELGMALKAVSSGETYLGLPTSLEVTWGSRATLFALLSNSEDEAS